MSGYSTQDLVPSPEKTGIKVIAFDQGGIYIGVNYAATTEALRRLGAENPGAIYTQSNQSGVVDEFECGKVSKADFYAYLRSNLRGLKPGTTDKELYDAWNAMLTGVIPGVLEFVKELRANGYITVVLSNADIIHHEGVKRQLAEASAEDLFEKEAFDEKFISYEIKQNKPYIKIFEEVQSQLRKKFSDKNILPETILFIDDSEKHIVGRNEKEGAVRVGWRGLLVPSNSSAQNLKTILIKELQQLVKNFMGSNKYENKIEY